MRVALASALVACSSPPQQPIPLSNAPSIARHGPSPRITRGGMYGLTAVGIPAVAADGTRIVAAFRESDGARGMPNLTLVITDRRDTELDRHVVLSVAEADQMLDDADGKNPALDARIAGANRWLHDRHAPARFEALAAFAPAPAQVPSDRTTATRDGVTVEWKSSHLRITDGVTVLVDTRTPPSWLPENFKIGTNVCLRSANLGGAAIDRTKRLAVVTISYTADSDFCLEPADQHHVVTW